MNKFLLGCAKYIFFAFYLIAPDCNAQTEFIDGEWLLVRIEAFERASESKNPTQKDILQSMALTFYYKGVIEAQENNSILTEKFLGGLLGSDVDKNNKIKKFGYLVSPIDHNSNLSHYDFLMKIKKYIKENPKERKNKGYDVIIKALSR